MSKNSENKKKVLILGATSGIGKGLAELYSSKGFIVGATGRRTALLEELQQNNSNIHIKTFDILASDSTARLQELIDEMGGVDIAIISSGIGFVNRSLDWEIENSTAQTNVVGFTRMADYLYHYFSNKGSGHLAGISSIASYRGLDLCPAYSASKSYVSVYLEALRRKVNKEKGKRIKVSTILPGFIDTPLLGEGTPTIWVATVDKAVRQMYHSMQRFRRKIYITRRWRWVAALARIVPGWLYDHF